MDGGAARNDLLMQFQADLLGVPVLRPTNTETTAFGAAALAGLGVGFWQDEGELAALWKLERRFEPRMSRDAAAARRAAGRRPSSGHAAGRRGDGSGFIMLSGTAIH